MPSNNSHVECPLGIDYGCKGQLVTGPMTPVRLVWFKPDNFSRQQPHFCSAPGQTGWQATWPVGSHKGATRAHPAHHKDKNCCFSKVL